MGRVDAADRPLEFVASARSDLSAFPQSVKAITGFALRQLQRGKIHPNVRQMKGKLRDILEIVANDDSGERTFRTTCTAKIGHVIYVLHAFQKKSKSKIATPRRDLHLIFERFRAARGHYEENYKNDG